MSRLHDKLLDEARTRHSGECGVCNGTGSVTVRDHMDGEWRRKPCRACADYLRPLPTEKRR